MKQSKILVTKQSRDYELLDSGEGQKLERFGNFVLSRPDPQALWHKRLGAEWKKIDAEFGGADSSLASKGEKGKWIFKKQISDKWKIEFGGLSLNIKPTAFKHTGLFPEQSANWDWLREKIGSVTKKLPQNGDVEVLNLFGYTGGATLACTQAGAKVVHIDGSKAAINWARENAELSKLKDKPIRWIVEDARTFVKRELKRGRVYDGIIMDPPAFGHGPENELWKIEEDLLTLIDDCIKLLKPQPLFFLINGYSAGYSALAYENILLSISAKYGGNIEMGELAIEETVPKNSKENPRLLPTGIFARWSAQ